jgi:hypothetical protein
VLLRSFPARRSLSAKFPSSSLASPSLLVRSQRVLTVRAPVPRVLVVELRDVAELVAVAVEAALPALVV